MARGRFLSEKIEPSRREAIAPIAPPMGPPSIVPMAEPAISIQPWLLRPFPSSPTMSAMPVPME